MALVYPAGPVGLDAGSELRMDMAGAEANLCIGLSRLGHRAMFISRVGDDPFGARIRAQLILEKVEVHGLITDAEAPTGVFFRENLADGQRRVYYYRSGSAASHLGPEDVRQEWFAGVKIVHLTGITPALSKSCAEACRKAIRLAKDVGALVSFDPNYRPRLWDEETARKSLLPFIEQADLLLMGHEDARAILCAEGSEDCLLAAAAIGPQVVVLKQAERGALAWMGGKIIHVPAYPVERVLDPVGAGDGFDAGFLAGWLRGFTMEESLRLGARVGAAAVGVFGDYHGYPHAEEIWPVGRE